MAEQTADERLHGIAVRLAVYQRMNPHYKIDDIVAYFQDEILSFTCDEIKRYMKNREITK
jgi:hypothetical protein